MQGSTFSRTLLTDRLSDSASGYTTMSSAAPFTFGERQGLILLAETSAVSACAIIGLLSYIAVCGARNLQEINN